MPPARLRCERSPDSWDSTVSRALNRLKGTLNGGYQYMDLVPKGRDEQDPSYSMAWVRRHDEYGR